MPRSGIRRSASRAWAGARQARPSILAHPPRARATDDLPGLARGRYAGAMTLPRVLGVLLLSPLLGACAWFRPKPPEYEWVSLGDEVEVRDVVVPTEGPDVGARDEVQLHYDLTLEDGTAVESSRERGQPIQVTLGTGALPVGLERGLVGMKLFGRRRIVVPSALGYGHEGRPPFIPPDATLVFDVEVLGLVPAGGPAPEAKSPQP